MTTPLFGAHPSSRGTTFRLWAPVAEAVDLIIDRPIPMSARRMGWYEVTVPGVGAGTRYRYRINGHLIVPDPASAFQPEDISGPSEIVDHSAYDWKADTWRGRPWQEAVFLEAHVGTFTPAGTYRAIIDYLDHLVTTGVTALELMPLNDFPGRRNWGYDGVLWYAPDSAYGRPDDLKALIDEAHLRGLMVFIDAVYNHFGPEGNYLGYYAPAFFDAATSTPWGAAIDYQVPEVRQFAIESALAWLRDYRFDGLRLDAVHAIRKPDGMPHLLEDLSRAVGALAGETGRHIHLVLENDANAADLLAPAIEPPDGHYRAQWNDDYHHAWHVLLTDEHDGYYRDYAPSPGNHLLRTLTSGFAYQGEVSAHRGHQARGQPSGMLSPLAFVNFLQNHDQIGNRPLGERLVTLAPSEAIEAALAVTLLAPMPPLLFMGEEWGSRQQFPFFCDFQGDLAEAVRRGRHEEFSDAYALYGEDVPDPLAEATFQDAKLDWASRETAAGRRRLDLVRKLLLIRRREITPYLGDCRFEPQQFAAATDPRLLRARFRLTNGHLSLVANIGGTPIISPDHDRAGIPIWGGDPPDRLPPWSVYWWRAG